MKIYMLGCGGWIPSENETSCFLVEEKENLIMLDAGTGVSNLNKYNQVLSKYETLSIILSHYHLDHLIGMIYLLPFIKDKKLNIYGPGIPVYPQSTEYYLNNLLQKAFFSRPLDKFSKEVKCYDYGGKDFFIGDVKIQTKLQQHSSPSFQLTIDDRLIYATDTIFNSEQWSEIGGGRILLHECWDIQFKAGVKHTSVESLLKGIPEELQKRTFLIHQNPEWTKKDYSQIIQMTEGTGIQIPKDGDELTI